MNFRSAPRVGRAFLTVTALLLSAGCAHQVQLEASARPDALARVSYTVRDLSLVADPTSPVAVAGGNYVRTALSAKGLYEAPAKVKADIDVSFDYSLNVRQREFVVQETIWSPPTEDINNHGSLVKGYKERRTTEVTYEKALHVVATEKAPSTPGATPRVWDISVSYQDRDPNIEKAMPLLAAAVCDRIGDNTEGPVTIHLRDKDEVVAFIKRGL